MKTTILSLAVAACAACCIAEEAPVEPAPNAPREAVARRRMPPPGMGSRGMKARPFGKLSDGRETKIWRLTSPGGLVMDFTDYGGRLVRAYAPDRFGNLADVTIGWNTPGEYEKYGFCAGTLIGRFGNRIRDGKFTLDGTEYQLAVNEDGNGRHCNLHSGPKGWDDKVWNARPYRKGPVQCIEFTCVSPDGDMGFPGTVNAKVTYSVMPDNSWRVDYEATTDKPTVVNLTHHSYWNLAGEASGSVLGQELQIFADEYSQTDAGLIPTQNAPVAGTGFDFTTLRPIGAMMDWMKAQDALKPMDNWYDHNFVLRGKTGEMKKCVFMRDPASGRTLEILTTEPCLQMYGAQNFTADMPAKTAGRSLCPFAAIALETQHYPDSPNRPDFPSTVLRPGETYRSTTIYRFGVSK